MGVAFRHSGCRVAEQLGDGLEARALHHEFAGEGMPKVVEAEVADSGAVHGGLELASKASEAGEFVSAFVAEDVLAFVRHARQHRRDIRVDRDMALAAGFCLVKRQRVGGWVDVGPAQAQDLAPAHAGFKRHEDDAAQEGGACGEEPLLLAGAEVARPAFVLLVEEFDPPYGVLHDHIPLDALIECHLHDG